MSNHSLRRSGIRFKLRPMADSDSDFIHNLRVDPFLSRYINPTPADPAAQQTWLTAYYERSGDYYFCIVDQVTGERQGAISLYNVDSSVRSAEMGRWILRRGSLAAAEGVLLTYAIGFDDLSLDRIYCRTVSANAAVISFHRKAGLQTTDESRQVTLAGVTYGVTEQTVERSGWPYVAANLGRVAARVNRLLS